VGFHSTGQFFVLISGFQRSFNYESSRSVANVMEWIAGHQCQGRRGPILQDARVIRIDYDCPVNNVDVSPLRGEKLNLISGVNILEPAKKTIAMPRNGNVPSLSGKGCSADPSHPTIECDCVGAVQHRDFQMQLRDPQNSYRMSRVWCPAIPVRNAAACRPGRNRGSVQVLWEARDGTIWILARRRTLPVLQRRGIFKALHLGADHYYAMRLSGDKYQQQYYSCGHQRSFDRSPDA
jgi:hypothetical protein